MRSGSTLLRLILDSHERIAIGPESGFVRAVPFIKNLPPWTSGPGWYRRLGLSEQEMDARIAGFFDGLFRQYAEAQGKVRWGDKTPQNVGQMAFLARLFPEAVFVGTVRHPGAVVASLRRRGRPFAQSLRLWTERNQELVRSGEDLGDRFAVVRYEDLVRRPEPVLRKLVAFLDEPWTDSLLVHHEVQRAKGAPKITDGGTRTQDPIDSSRVDQWRGSLTPEQRRIIGTATAGLLELFGYTCDGVDELEPAELLLDGAALVRRRQRVGLRLAEPVPHRWRSPIEIRRARIRHALALLSTDPMHTARRLITVMRERTSQRENKTLPMDGHLVKGALALLAKEHERDRPPTG